MSDNAVITVESVSKIYRIFNRPVDRLKQQLFGAFRCYYREHAALEGVDLKVRAGEVVGILGRNGSGKSTLLQIISGVLPPTSGRAVVNGRLAALLELGSGFDPEFTGRENVYFNGALLGLSRAEIEARIDEIIDFADIGDYIDQPVKTYSSGMFLRLAFAVQAHVDASVVIVDEALAVGDIFFRQKCYARLQKLRDRGAAVLLVSHSMADIEQHCERAIVLHKGRVVFEGGASAAIKNYYLYEQAHSGAVPPVSSANVAHTSSGESKLPLVSEESDLPLENRLQVNATGARCVRVALSDVTGQARRIFRAGDRMVVTHEYVVDRALEVPIAGLVIHSESGVIVHGKNTLQLASDVPRAVGGGSLIRCRQEVELELAPGEYTFEVGLAALPAASYEHFESMTPETALQDRTRLVQVPHVGSFSVVPATETGCRAAPHHGLVDLAGAAVIEIAGFADRGSVPETVGVSQVV
jgi:lipopolysaccharide transport system ATP-binding protein